MTIIGDGVYVIEGKEYAASSFSVKLVYTLNGNEEVKFERDPEQVNITFNGEKIAKIASTTGSITIEAPKESNVEIGAINNQSGSVQIKGCKLVEKVASMSGSIDVEADQVGKTTSMSGSIKSTIRKKR
jgi:hypothetical protein